MPDPAPIVVESTQIEILDGVAYASGGVRIKSPDGLFEADSATLDLATGKITGERVLVTVCDCPGPDPWSVAARHVELVPDEVVRFRGGWLRVLDRRVVPLPAGSIPLERRSGLLAPSAGFAYDGLRVQAPIYVTLGRSADATFTPEIRTRRGPRLLAEQRYATRTGSGTTGATLGYDWIEDGWRGGVDWVHQDGGPVGFASVGRLTTDPDVPRDYGDAFLARRQPWSEVRTLGWAGPAEVAVDVFQSEVPMLNAASVAARPGAVVLPGGFVAGGEGSVGAVTRTTGGLGGLLAGDLSVSRPVRLGPVRVVPSLVGAGGLAFAGAPDPDDALVGQVESVLLAWHAGPHGLARVESGAVARYTVTPDGSEPLLAPMLRWRASGPQGATGLTAVIGVDGEGTLDAWASHGAFSTWGHLALADGALGPSWAGATGDLGPVRASAGWLFADASALRQPAATPHDLHQVRTDVAWTLPGRASVFQIGAAGAYDLDGASFLSRAVSLRWTHPTDCLSIGVVGRFDTDRPLPDVSLAIHARP